MAFFADGSVCNYFVAAQLPPLLAVGWLELGYQYAIGDAGPEVSRRLREFQYGAWSGWQPVLFLGGHACDFCRDEQFPMIKNLFIPGDGVTYVTPEGIVHYVSHHGYRPPADFCAALISSPPVNSPEYLSRLHDNGWAKEVGNPDHLCTQKPPNPRLHPAALATVVARLANLVRRRG